MNGVRELRDKNHKQKRISDFQINGIDDRYQPQLTNGDSVLLYCDRLADTTWISTVDGEIHCGNGRFDKGAKYPNHPVVDTTKPHMKAAFNGVITIYSGANNPICSFDPEKGKWYYNDKPISKNNLNAKVKNIAHETWNDVYQLLRKQGTLMEFHKSLQYKHKNSDGKVVYHGQRPIKNIQRPLYGTRYGTNGKDYYTGYFQGEDPENLTILLNYNKAPVQVPVQVPVIEGNDPKHLLMKLTECNTELQNLLSKNESLEKETILRLLNLRMQEYKILSGAHKTSQLEAQVGKTNSQFNTDFCSVKSKGKTARQATENIISMEIIKEQRASEKQRINKLERKQKQPQDSTIYQGRIKPKRDNKKGSLSRF